LIPLKDNVPTSGFPIVTVLLIVVNVVVFGWQLSFAGDNASSPALGQLGISERDQNSIEYGAIPYRITHPGDDCAVGATRESFQTGEADIVCEGTREFREARAAGAAGTAPFAPLDEAPWLVTVFTSMFMHGGILHIAFNMLFLWIFGNNVEDSMGRLRFVLFYLLAGIVAVYSQALLDTGSTIPTIGASGAVAGVLGAYALLLPQARVLTLIFIIFFVTLIEIPAYVMLGIWFVLQFLPAVGQVATPDVAGGGGVAYFAHVGGFIFGLALIRLFARRRPALGGDVAW
jgi:membrane associated rhomboid family serine protease